MTPLHRSLASRSLVPTLLLVACLSGCSGGGGGSDGGPPAHLDAGTKATGDARPRGNAADAIIKRIEQLEPRAILSEGVVGPVNGSVTIDTTTRVVLPRRHVVDGGVQVDVPDGGAIGRAPARAGVELQIGDTVTTGSDGTVDLQLPEEQGTLSVGPDSTVRVSRFSVNEWILLRGRARADLKSPGRGRRILRIATPTALTTIFGDGAVVAVADDGATRVYSVAGLTKVRGARPIEEVEVQEGKMVEVNLEAQAGSVASISGDATAAADEWRTGRAAIVQQDTAGLAKKLVKRMQADLGSVDAAIAKLAERRDKNREILKRSTAARTSKSNEVGAIQEELIQNSRTLVEVSDLARGTAMRILLHQELLGGLRERAGDSGLGAAAAQLDALTARVDTLREEIQTQFRRFPRRERRDRPTDHKGVRPLLPGATLAPQNTDPIPPTTTTPPSSEPPSTEPR